MPASSPAGTTGRYDACNLFLLPPIFFLPLDQLLLISRRRCLRERQRKHKHLKLKARATCRGITRPFSFSKFHRKIPIVTEIENSPRQGISRKLSLNSIPPLNKDKNDGEKQEADSTIKLDILVRAAAP